MAELSLVDLGELEILKRLQPFCSKGVGDDAILQPVPPDTSIVVTTDVLVEGVHFSPHTLSPESTGWRAAAVNLSDLAAMGATPIGITVGASLPSDTPWNWLKAFYQGAYNCLTVYGGEILGGDLTRSSVKTMSVTALGYGKPDQTLYRKTAHPQQAIVVTGVHGASRAGLALLTGELVAPDISKSTRQHWISAHQLPTPRLDAIATLKTLAQEQAFSISQQMAGMDSSDGLANAVLQLCQQSGIGAQIIRSHLPIPPGLAAVIGPSRAENWTLYGGEDFELVLCLPQDLALTLVKRLGNPCQIIGYTTANRTIELVETLGDPTGQPLTLAQGYQHFHD